MKFPKELRYSIRLAKDYLASAAATQISAQSRTNAYYNPNGAYILFRISACTKGKLFSVDFAMTLAELGQMNDKATKCCEKFTALAREIQSCVKRERLLSAKMTA